MLRKVILACIAIATIALTIPTEASARYYGWRGHGYGYRYGGWGPRYYGYYPRHRYYGFYPYTYGYGYAGCWRSVSFMTAYGLLWRRVWVCG